MDRVHDTVAWYQKQIGSYDKQLWEQSVESRVLQGIQSAPRRNVKIKTELIDVDLVRGSTFSKAKPQVSWTYIAHKAVCRVVFYPLCYRWWRQQVTFKFWLFLLMLYILQVFTIIIFIRNVGDSVTKDELSLTLVVIPTILMLLLGVVHSHTVASHMSHRPPHREGKNRDGKRSRRNTFRSNSNPVSGVSASDQTGQRSTEPSKESILIANGRVKVEDSSSSTSDKKSVSWSNCDRKSQSSQKKVSTKSSQESDSESERRGRSVEELQSKGDNSSTSQQSQKQEDSAIKGIHTSASALEILSADSVAMERLENDINFHLEAPVVSDGQIYILNQDGVIDYRVTDHNPDINKESVTQIEGGQTEGGSIEDKKDAQLMEISSSIDIHPDMSEADETQTKMSSLELPSPKYTKDLKKESESDSERAESDSEIRTFQGLRRRKTRVDDSSESGASYCRPRRLTKDNKMSRKERELTPTSLERDDGNKGTVSSEEWEDRVQSDVTTSTYSTSSSDSELSENEMRAEFSEGYENTNSGAIPPDGLERKNSSQHVINLLQPPTSCSGLGHHTPPDKVSCLIWEGSEAKKVELTGIDIGWTIIEKVDNIPESSDYILIGLVFSLIIGCVPIVFKIYHTKDIYNLLNLQAFVNLLWSLNAESWRFNMVLANGILQRFCLSCVFFFLLSVADRTFKQRLLYAKHFCYLTSSRRARKFDMPHFRLNKVRNIKTWLSLRSYLKKRGPQRSVDVIVSSSFTTTIIILTLMCVQLLKDTETFLDFLCNWELLIWCMALGIYLMRFMTLGLKINKKYRNLSVLITEQINLYLQMEQKPHKKEELMVANNVLKLAEDLLKELESPFKISGVSANPVLYNIVKVVVLSAFSAVLTEICGFKLKLYKIKLKG
ncbi:protein PHTF1-like isoform X1 [Saccostrea echinata]|uniref:protein PHTF1-like isoform X1 n=1 Tax=Saccostrea echinata TaxID=191078 RepID=UPI002A7FD261|nr:protein PHTF1-like isoform X1 [Saccostrea echinata]